ncbi:MAG: hypothetical protein PUB18_06005 [bacterium]|nr:hypothetical protein [bacterium]
MRTYRKIILIFMFVVLTVLGPNEIANAAATCGNVDTQKWEYIETKSFSSAQVGNETGSSKKVCCERGALATVGYYCDFYKYIPTETSPNSSDGRDLKEGLIKDVPCDLGDGDWIAEGSYVTAQDDTMNNGTTKICCKGENTYNGGTTYSCNVYISKQYQEETGYSSDKNSVAVPVPANCGMLSEILPYLKNIFTLLKISVPVILIVLGTVDFAVPVLSNDKEALHKATSKFIKRCIVGILILLVPFLTQLLLNIYDDATGANTSTCGLGNININLWR